VSVPAVPLIVVAVVLMVLAGCLAAGEAAIQRLSRARVLELREEGRRGAAPLVRAVEDSAATLSVSTFLRVFAETGAAVCVTIVLVAQTDVWWQAALTAAAIMSAMSFALVGVGPRTLGQQHAEAVGLFVAPVLLAARRVLGPLARLLVLVGNALTPGRGYRDGPFASEAELRELVDIAQESELIEAGEREMIHSVFELGDTMVREVMVPRTEVVAIERGTSLRAAMSVFLRSGFSRIPVVGDGLDDVLGVIYLKDLARRLHEKPAAGRSEKVEAVMREALFVPDSKPVDDLLRQMQRDAGHVAIVVDEYGGTAGMVTLEDLVEEVIGEIADEYDVDVREVEELGPDQYRVRARLHVEELGELFGTRLHDEEVDTVGGLMAKELGRVPIAGSEVTVSGLTLTADRFEGRRNQLATVLVCRESAPEGVADAEESRQTMKRASDG
jgi:CBS domain containing-hemolysin-like protein